MEAKVENLGDNANCFMRTILISIFFLLIGHFYFGKNRTFLNWLDNCKYLIDIRKSYFYTFYCLKLVPIIFYATY